MRYALAGIVALLAALLSWWSFWGPYRWVSELQSWAWGVDWIQLSLLLCWAAFYTPMHVIVAAWERRHGAVVEPLTWRRAVAAANFLFEQRPGQLMGVGIIFFAMGGGFWSNAMTSGPLTSLTMAEADQGVRPRSRYVHLTGGRVLLDSELTFTRNGSAERYFPVVSNDTEQLRVFARLDGRDATAPPDELEGELSYDGLPGPLRAPLADKGLLAPDYFVLRHGSDPASGARAGAYMALFGALLIAIGWLWARRRKRASVADPGSSG